MVVFGSKSSSAKTKLFDQPLDKLFNPKAIKHFNETIAASNSRSPPALCQSLSAPLTSSTMTWAKLSQENSATKRKRAAARLRRFTIDANNNTSNLIQSLTSAPITNPGGGSALPLCISHPHQRLESNHSSPTLLTGAPGVNSSFFTTSCDWNEREVASREDDHRRNEGELNEDERCRLLLNVLPEPIKCLLNEIYLRGPSTVGIFRKSPNAKHCKELKQKLESSDFQLDAIEQYQVNVIASVFKEWLRSLPDCLLMSRLYPQWIDVAKLIEPLHSRLQQQLMQQSNDHTHNQNRLGSSSSSEDNLNGNLSRAPNGVQEATSLRSGVLAASPLTDNGQQQPSSENLSPTTLADDASRQQLSRALSCSIMTSDSGHSSTSTSPSSAMSTSSDNCNEVIGANEAAAARARQNFQKAQIQSQQLQANQSASYLKRKCYQQRQQQLNLIDCKSESGQLSSLISGNAATDGTPQSNQQQQASMSMEFSLRERRFECIRVVRQLLEALNETNLILLRAIICVLWHIADNSDYNKMSSNNLGVCIGQSLLNDELQQQQQNNSLQHRGKKLHSFSLSISSSSQLTPTNMTPDPRPTSNFAKRHRRARSQCLLASTLSLTNLSHLSTSSSPTDSMTSNGAQLASSISSNYLDSSGAQETAKFVPILVAFMIDNAKELFGSDVMNLFGPRKPLRVTENDVNQQPQENSNESMTAMNHQTTPSIGQMQQTSCTTEQLIGKSQDERFGSCDDSLECKSIVVTRNQVQPHCSDLVVKLSSDSPTSNNNHHQEQQPMSSTEQVHSFSKCKPVLVMHVGSQMATSKTSDHVTSRDVGGSALPVSNETKRGPASDATTSILIVNTPKKQALDHIIDLDCRATSELELNHNHQQDSSSSCASRASDGISDDDLNVKRRRQQQQKSDSLSGNSIHVDCGGRRQCRTDSSSSSSPLIVANVDSDEHGREATVVSQTTATRQQQHKQQRPLSATESTTSSSRASSSTSGVHSESPAFSCERHSSTSSSSVSPHNNSSAHTTNTCSSPGSSRCVSISSPSSSSSSTVHSNCTSPIEMDHSSVDVVDGNHHRNSHNLSRIAGNAARTISHNEAMRHNLISQVCLPPTVTTKTATATTTGGGSGPPVCEPKLSLNRDPGRGRRRTSFERPKSMVSLSRPSETGAGSEGLHQPGALRYSNDGHVSHQQYSSMAFDGVNKENIGYVFDSNPRSQQFQSHTLNRHTSASSQLVNINRMPKIPFQYTTSCYGGEAVLFYPSNAHLSQQQQQRQPQAAAAALHQHGDRFGTPAVQPRGCNRIQSLDRLTQLHHSSSHLHQQQPQRSHVMMLRDYYLSLQEQSQQQHQYRELVKRHQCKQQMLGNEQRASVTNAPTISNHFQLIHQQHQQQRSQSQPSQQIRQQVVLMVPTPVDPSQQPARSNVTTNPNAMQTSNEATKTGCNGNHELMREQPASVAVAHQRVQPRTARIRPNQFNGLYVKRATSPMRMDLGNANLITLDHHHRRHQTSTNIGKPLAPSGSSASNLMAISQSSLSQQSSKMSSSGHSSDDDERDCSSDECSTGGWMESTMV